MRNLVIVLFEVMLMVVVGASLFMAGAACLMLGGLWVIPGLVVCSTAGALFTLMAAGDLG